MRTDFDGGVNVMALPAAVAVLMLHDGDMGEKWYSARIVADDVDMGMWDRSM
ncbi:MAG: hypothetical protein WC701_13750 [Kiritimatiellales bacterium]